MFEGGKVGLFHFECHCLVCADEGSGLDAGTGNGNGGNSVLLYQ